MQYAGYHEVLVPGCIMTVSHKVSAVHNDGTVESHTFQFPYDPYYMLHSYFSLNVTPVCLAAPTDDALFRSTPAGLQAVDRREQCPYAN